MWLVGFLACHDPAAPPSAEPTVPTSPGTTLTDDGVRFRVASRAATAMEAWLYDGPLDPEPTHIVPLARVGDAWEGSLPLEDLGDSVYYGLRAWGPNWPYDPAWTPGSEVGFRSDVDADGNRFDPNKLLLDPTAREVSHDPDDWGPYTTGDRRSEDTGPFAPKSVLVADVEPPRPGPDRPPQDEVVYEVHVRALTMLDPDVPEALRGTYAGAALRAPALAALGVTAIELLPVHETFNDQNDRTADADGDNFWGYSSLSFFAPDRRYAADRSPGGPTAEFRDMVDAFHAEGISVFLDVVYNHTAEGGAWSDDGATAPLFSWRGLDNAAYYQLDGPTGYRSDNGVGPNWNAADPLARQLVLDSLSYWEGLGVDGFRFDLAPILGNGCGDGCFSFEPDDPEGILYRATFATDALLIAEPWGATGEAYQAGRFPAGWAEWNDGFRDAVRADQNRLGEQDTPLRAVLDALLGSPDRFGGRAPWSSVAFVVAHDGFTLADLHRCDAPDNDQPWPYGPSGGGSTWNLSSDHGGDPVAQDRAARTTMALTLLAAGIPMFTGGDELLRSQRCNNNPYNLDSVATWIDWPALEAEGASFEAFTRGMLALRAAHPVLRPAGWRGGELTVFEPSGAVASDAYLDDPSWHAMLLSLDGRTVGDQPLLVLYNGWSDGVHFTLPPAPSGGPWHLAADTHEWLAGNVLPVGADAPLPDDTYLLGQRSVSVLVDPG